MPANHAHGLAAWQAILLGFVPVSLLDAALVLRGDGVARLEHCAYVVGYRMALALVLAGLAWLLVRVDARPRGRSIAAMVLLVASLGLGSLAFADDLYSYLWPRRVALTVLLSLLPAALIVARFAAAWLERRVGRGRLLRAPFVLAGLGAAIANHIVIPYGNPGPHLGLLVLAGVGVALAIVGAALRIRVPGLVLVACAVWGLWSVVSRPSSDASLALSRDESAALYPFVYPLHPVADHDFPGAEVDAAWLAAHAGGPQWFAPRDSAPEVPPTRPLVDANAVLVVVLTIDALRHDVFVDPQYAAVTPHLQALRAEATFFADAHAPSSSTAPSIASIFTGRYLSQMEWKPVPYKHGQRIRYYPVGDPSPRVAELLPAGVDSFTVPSIERLRQQYALLRGFKAEAEVDTEEDLMAAEVVPQLLAWLLARPGPALAYAHLMDGHSPYDLRGTQGAVFDRYVREFAGADAQIGALVAALRRSGQWSRTVLIVAADHGEGFGEHGQTQHGGSLHEELTRVPMLIRVPGQPARQLDAPVSLIDLGPTILDLFQRPTPGAYLGESLLPLVAGEAATLTRPIALESTRLHRAIVFKDRMKCIWRSREDQFELYDLARDPGELDNLLLHEPSAALRVAAVRKFFRAHAFARPGYVTPHYW